MRRVPFGHIAQPEIVPTLMMHGNARFAWFNGFGGQNLSFESKNVISIDHCQQASGSLPMEQDCSIWSKVGWGCFPAQFDSVFCTFRIALPCLEI